MTGGVVPARPSPAGGAERTGGSARLHHPPRPRVSLRIERGASRGGERVVKEMKCPGSPLFVRRGPWLLSGIMEGNA